MNGRKRAEDKTDFDTIKFLGILGKRLQSFESGTYLVVPMIVAFA
jgi:hypothetical protein